MEKQLWKGLPLLGPIPPVLVSCGSPEKPNLITVAWTGIVCSQPPRVSISLRPERYSNPLIRQSGEFVINLPTQSLLRAVDWCGVKSGRDVDKFAAMKLTPAPCSKVGTVQLAESPVSLECRVFQTLELGSHDMFLADILAVDVAGELLDSTGSLHMERAALAGFCHGQYFAMGKSLGHLGFSVKKKSTFRKEQAQAGRK